MITDKLENAPFYYGINEKITAALKYLENTDLSEVASGRYDIDGDDIFVLVQDYKTKSLSEGKLEAHRKYIDIQYIIKGREKIGYININNLKPSTGYDETKDIIFFEGAGELLTAEKGTFIIFVPQDAHIPGIEVNSSEYVKKAVIKIKSQ